MVLWPMFADPLYYLGVVVLCAVAYFLLPNSLAFQVGLIYRQNPIGLMRGFRWSRPFRAWSAGTSLAASLIAPTLFGTHPLSFAPLAAGLATLAVSDFLHLTGLARGAAGHVSNQTGKSD